MTLLCPVCWAELSPPIAKCPRCGAECDVLFHTVQIGERYLQKAKKFAEAHRWHRMLKALRRASSFLPPSHQELLNLKAQAYAALGLYSNALQITHQGNFEDSEEWQAKEKRKEASREWLLFAYLLNQKKFFSSAQAKVEKAVSLLPEWSEPYWFQFYQALTQDDQITASQCLNHLIRSHPDSFPDLTQFIPLLQKWIARKPGGKSG